MSPTSSIRRDASPAPSNPAARDETTPLVRRAAVIGAGSMGGGIAAHIANAGVPVLLLDVVPEGATDRNALAKAAVARQLSTGGFMHPDRADLVETGNVEDHLDRLADADWIVEAVFEDLAVKQALYRKIEAVRHDGSIISSNTSTIPLHQLVESLGPRFAAGFVITHFFNPPRQMQLLELVRGEGTHADVYSRMQSIGHVLLGKTVVACRDTPGFIANRVGNYWMSVAVLEARRLGLTVEEADAVMGAPFGIPRTGIFGLFDFVGINLVPLVWGSFMRTLGPDDAHRKHDVSADPLIADMIARGLVGRAGPGGFYRRKGPDGAPVDEVIDLATGDYRPREMTRLAGQGATDLRQLCEQTDRMGRYAWAVLSNLVTYAATAAPEIAEDVPSIDRTLRLGYNWKHGPFELADRAGLAWIVARLEQEGRAVPDLLRQAADRGGFYIGDETLTTDGRPAPSVEGVLTLAAVKRGRTRIDGNASASLWDMGDGVAALEIHTKLNACDAAVVDLVERAPVRVAEGFRALVIGSDEPRAFSAGADLDTFIGYIHAKDWDGLARFVARGQSAWLGLKYAPVPVVAAAVGLALGGGCELMMHADAVVAHSELNAGFPERKVGIIPGWGGVTQMLLRWTAKLRAPGRAAAIVFDVISNGDPTSSAHFARGAGFLRADDDIVMNRDRVLALAKQRAIRMAGGYVPPERAMIEVAGASRLGWFEGRIDMAQADGVFTEVDGEIALALAGVLIGGNAPSGARLSERELMALELAAMVDLAKRPKTLERLEHMRATNRPLRN
jgi:3-hydroxyacyl-CoA dehydrogenase